MFGESSKPGLEGFHRSDHDHAEQNPLVHILRMSAMSQNSALLLQLMCSSWIPMLTHQYTPALTIAAITRGFQLSRDPSLAMHLLGLLSRGQHCMRPAATLDSIDIASEPTTSSHKTTANCGRIVSPACFSTCFIFNLTSTVHHVFVCVPVRFGVHSLCLDKFCEANWWP